MIAVRIPAADVQRIASTAAMLQSPNTNEVATAGAMLVRQLERHGLRIGDVLLDALGPKAGGRATLEEIMRPRCPDDTLKRTNWRAWARYAAANPSLVTPWEARFLASVAEFRNPSDPQATTLWGIVNKLHPEWCGRWGAP